MKPWLLGSTLACLALLPGLASAESLGSYSACKRKLSGAALQACMQCVGGGNFYQSTSRTCGLAPGMKPSKAAKADPPPPAPKAMPDTQKKYVKVPAGRFTIGELESEVYRQGNEYQSVITLTRPILVKTTEVTQNEWYFVMKAPPTIYQRDCMNCAVTNVTWRQAVEYMNALSKLENVEPCYTIESTITWKGLDCVGYRLPTEAEWEYVARAGTTGRTYGPIDDVAWHQDNSDGKLHPVGGKAANSFGVYDMLGNASEWVWDAYDWSAFQKAQTDPIIGGKTVDEASSERMVRGSNYTLRGTVIRVASRDERMPANTTANGVGFRPVRTTK